MHACVSVCEVARCVLVVTITLFAFSFKYVGCKYNSSFVSNGDHLVKIYKLKIENTYS